MSSLRVIAIDGAAGSGKTTLARALSRALGLPYLNTGLMYRALTLAALRSGLDLDNGDGLADLTSRLRFTMSPLQEDGELRIDGAAPALELEAPEVDAAVSAVSRHPQVRTLMRERQRALGLAGAVVEGRDIASVVFPDAVVKIYLVADPGARIERRAGQRPVATSDVARSLRDRDAFDSAVNPFEPAGDAVVIDTGVLDADSTLRAAIELVRSRAPELIE